MGCYRCIVVDPPEREMSLEEVGVCRRCGTMACSLDGELDADYPEFVCAICEPSRLSESAGIPPPRPPGGGGGGGMGGPTPTPPPSDSGGGAAAYANSEEFERRKPAFAEASRKHREAWRDDMEPVLEDLLRLGSNETAHALIAEHLGDDLDPDRVRGMAILLSHQLEAASEQGRLKPELLADAFGMAAWAIGAEPRVEPTAHQLRYIRDPRLRIVLGRFPIRAIAGSA